MIPEKVWYGALMFVCSALLKTITKYLIKVLSDKVESRFKALEDVNEDLKREVKLNSKEIVALDKKISVHERELANQDKKIDKVNDKIDNMNEKIDNLPSKIFELLRQMKE